MRKPARWITTRTRLGLAALTGIAVLVGNGCSDDADEQPIDVAEDRLDAAISDGTLVAGFTVGTASLDVIVGSPPSQEQLYPEPSQDRSPVDSPAYPPTVRGSDFPLTQSVQRARTLLADCDGWGSVEVQALSPGIVVTAVTCDPAAPPSQVLLDDAPLPSIPEPFSVEAISTLWSEIEAAGLGDELHAIRVDRADDSLQVQFHGTSPLRTYEWNRGLADPGSMVLSHPFEPGTTTLALDQIPADTVSASYDDAIAGLENPDEADILVVDIDPETGSPRLVLENASATELVSLPLSD